MKHSLFLVLLSGVLVSGCALQRDVDSLNNHLMALSQQNSRLEQRITKIEEGVAELDRQLGQLKQRNLEVEKRNSSALQEKSAQMETRIENAQKTQDENNRQLREQLAGLRVMLTDMRQEMQVMSGKSEISDHLLKQKTKAAEDLEKKLETRLSFLEEQTARYQDRFSKLEQYLNFESSQKKPPEKGSETKTGKELSDDELYNRAKQSFDKGEFETARKGFQDILDKNPSSQNADNAQFWIGEIYYREKWYEKAILEYQKVIENYPKGNKVPASLLKQGFAFLNIGDQTNARLILRELTNKYPESNEAKIAGKKLDELK
ncbi:MAG: tol-pal system protein YbgF [Thermodesulfobacteriota bacterium]